MLKNKVFWVGALLSALVTLLSVLLTSSLVTERLRERDVAQSVWAMEEVRLLEIALLEQQRAIRNYVMGIDSTLVPFQRVAPRTTASLNRLPQLLHSPDMEAIADIRALELRKNDFWEQLAGVRRTEGSEAAIKMMVDGEGNVLVSALLSEIDKIAQNERGALGQNIKRLSELHQWIDIIYGAYIATIVLILFLLVHQTIGAMSAKRLEAELSDIEGEISHQRMLSGELSHRVKNTFTTIQSLARQTIVGAIKKNNLSRETQETVERHYKMFEDRLIALSAANALITQTDGKGAGLREIATSAISLLVDSSRFFVSGPRVFLSPSSAITMNLLIHELATNALKYGSLSNDEGYIILDWCVKNDIICIVWRECDGPNVAHPEQRGFGSKLIEKAAMREMGGKAKMRFDPDGLVCSIEIPLSDKVWLYENYDH
jgi:two-component sensor histidine kinase